MSNWERYQQHLYTDNHSGFMLDISRIPFPDGYVTDKLPMMRRALDEMKELENGSVANRDENRMVGHYWLRSPGLAPDNAIKQDITKTQKRIREFADKIHRGEIAAPAGPFTHVLLVGIGGSALGPQFVARALGTAEDPLEIRFIDNTDPDGIDHVLAGLGDHLARTLVIVISKSGGTKETRNGMVEVQHAFRQRNLAFAKQALAVTGNGSQLAQRAESDGWLDIFPMWDWVGGRTSETAAVGLLPAALQGLDIDRFLTGAADMDKLTRDEEPRRNPALLMALMWFYETGGKGEKDMVILPYKDRLMLLSKYLQQLVMESLGKEYDRNGNAVYQGIAVYGNKGSTDQHAYIQQLREGVNNFFAVFIDVLRDREGHSVDVDEGLTSGDYLQGFLLGTRRALSEKSRPSITITIPQVNAYTVGQLIALFERAVGFYASFVNINAYHQPGVEAGKKAAGNILALKKALQQYFREGGAAADAPAAAGAIDTDDIETVYQLLLSLAAMPDKPVTIAEANGTATRFQAEPPK
jgi:glucose-6-phosphate isomerase